MVLATRCLWGQTALGLLLAAGSAWGGSVTAAEVSLVTGGKPRATIVLSDMPTSASQLAAFELRHFVEKISGARLPIVREPNRVQGTVILVGESRRSRALGVEQKGLAPQEYVVRTHRNGLLLMGHDGRHFDPVVYESYSSLYKAASGPIGTCYAVHSFLENQLGVKWYLPSESLGAVVPRSLDIVIKDLAIQRCPDAPVRSVYPLFANTERLGFNQWDKPRNSRPAGSTPARACCTGFATGSGEV